MNLFQAVFLGIIQGLTELLPVSSSAHLNIMPWLFHWEEIPSSYDLALHIGTLFAILIYFFKDWIQLIRGGCRTAFKKENSAIGKIFWYIVAATVPAGIMGILLEKCMEILIGNNLNIQMLVIAAALIIMGVILYLVDKKCDSSVDFYKITFKQGFFIGVSQALAAAIPGVSRSGITMTTARAMGIERESAAKYSFLLSAPIVAAAALFSIGDFVLSAEFFAGVIASFISGMLVIKFLMSFLKKGSFKIFAIYRVLFGLFIIVTAIVRIAV